MGSKTVRSLDRRRRTAVCLVATMIGWLGSIGSGQQPDAPQTGAPRVSWPQRPGVFRPLAISALPVDVGEKDAAIPQPEFVPNELLVQFRPDVPDDARAAARAAVNGTLASHVRADGSLERLTTNLPVTDAIAILQALAQVEFAEPNWIVQHAATADEPYYTGGWLWGMYGDATAPANAFGSQAGELWTKDVTGSNAVYVAVIDQGIDYTHPDLAPNMWTNPFDPVDGLDNDGNGKVDDVRGWDFFENNSSIYDGDPLNMDVDSHGTHVAGTIGARGGNGIGVAGMAWNVTIISAKFLGPYGGTTENAVRAVDYITDLKTRHGLNIIATNNSWGGGGYSAALHQAIIRAAKQGILFFAAAGNTGSNTDQSVHYPSGFSTTVTVGSEAAAGFEAVTSVAALTSTGLRSSFSNYGATTVDIGAPGSSILSTWPQGGYYTISGTSMATPHVTGAAVLYKAAHPGASAAEIRSALLGYGIATPSLAGITATGRRLNVGEFDLALRLTIDDASGIEGDGGITNATFTVSLSQPSPSPVTVRYVSSDLTATSTVGVANPSSISIPSFGNASPYPSTIRVPSGYGTISKLRVVLDGFSHTWPSDVDVLLVGPGGQTCVLMSDVGGATTVSNTTLTFDDAGLPIPTGTLQSGTYRPTNSLTGDLFASPAPSGPHGSALSVFNGTAAAGDWRLFVVDDAGGDIGAIARGWSLEFVGAPGADYQPASGTVTFPAGSTSQSFNVSILADGLIERAETFKVTLLDSTGASIEDDEGLATIVDDDFLPSVLSGQFISASHIVDLRTAISGARTARGMAPYGFTDPTLTAQSTSVRAIHIVDLRTALAEVYTSLHLTQPSYTDPVITPGVTIVKAAHINEIAFALASLP
jgi:subtilisin family serine protease